MYKYSIISVRDEGNNARYHNIRVAVRGQLLTMGESRRCNHKLSTACETNKQIRVAPNNVLGRTAELRKGGHRLSGLGFWVN